MRIINKKYLLIILLIVVILTGAIVLKPKEKLKLDDVILKQEVNNKTFAMYIQNDNQYEKYESTKFPDGYELNLQLSKCIDNNGNELENVLSYENNKVALTSNKSSYCYLYFDKKETLSNLCNDYTNLGECIKNQEANMKSIYDLSNTLVGDMYRYQGTDNVDNWICFGTENNCSTTEEDIDKHMYRIIGITPAGELKLIKETLVKEDNVQTFQWHNKASDSECGSRGEYCTWPDSMIFKRLNGISNGNIKGTNGDSNIFIGNNYYEYLTNNSSWLDKIEEKLWKYGELKDYHNFNSDKIYETEKNFTEVNSILDNSPLGKIGLMYLHDYSYANSKIEVGTYENLINTWIYFQKDNYNKSVYFEWLLPSGGWFHTNMWLALYATTYEISISYLNTENIGVRPVFYLKPTISLKQGTIGTKSNPYIINVT